MYTIVGVVCIVNTNCNALLNLKINIVKKKQTYKTKTYVALKVKINLINNINIIPYYKLKFHT